MTIILTQPDNNSITDIENLKPKEHARELKRRGIDGVDVGAGTIYNRLVKEYGKAHPEMPSYSVRPSAVRAVNRWIEGIECEGLDVPYDAKTVPPELRSFALRIDLVKSKYLVGGHLTIRESGYIGRALTEFQDPFGETVDLIAQYAVIWELAKREAMGKESADIEGLFAFAPWRDEANSELYLLSVRKNLSKSAPLLGLISPDVPDGENPLFTETMIGAYAQLGLAWCFGWSQEHSGGQKLVLSNRTEESKIPTTIEYWKPKCNWKKLIEARLTDQLIPNVTIHIERESSND